VVMAPKDENELQHMLKTAVAYGGPVSVRYPRGRGVGVSMDEEPEVLDIGKGEVVREGSDLAVFAVGSTVHPALEAAETLSREGINVRVINSRFVKPLDESLLCETAASLKKVIIVEENVLMGGFGSAVLELFEMRGLSDIRVRRLGIGDEFVQHATQTELRELYGIDAKGIAGAVRELLNTSVPRSQELHG
jgi:1-deoxy-D-xylulose-5-phosphate synthase